MSKHSLSLMTSSAGRFLVAYTEGSNAGGSLGLIDETQIMTRLPILRVTWPTQLLNSILLGADNDLMNVFNKIKSKKIKQPASQAPPTQTQPEPFLSKPKPQPQPQPQLQIHSMVPVPQSAPKHSQEETYTRSLALSRSDDSRLERIVQPKKQEFDDNAINSFMEQREQKRLMKDKLQSGEFDLNQLSSYPYCFNVKKGQIMRDVCILEGQLLVYQGGKQKERRKKVSLSCTLDTIQSPEGISRILLNKIAFLSEHEGIFMTESIAKIIEKSYRKG